MQLPSKEKSRKQTKDSVRGKQTFINVDFKWSQVFALNEFQNVAPLSNQIEWNGIVFLILKNLDICVKNVWFSYLFQKMWRRKKLGHLILEVVSVFAWLPPKRGNATEEPMGAAPKQIDWASLIRGQRGSVGRDIFGRNSRGKEMYGRKKVKEECEANILRLR